MNTLKMIAIMAAVLSLLVPISAAVMSDQGEQAQSNDVEYAYLMTYDTTTSQITGVYKDGNIASKTNPETGVHQGQSGSWTWSSTTGLGPFNMYYQAVNTVDHTAYSDVMNGKIGHVAYVLDPADLTKVIIGGQSTTSANFSSHLSEYNIMLVIPTVYWYSDGAGNLYISNTDSNSYIPSEVNAKMNAYAHTVNGTMSGDKITGGDVYENIMIGVYEAYSDNTLGMTSQSGVTPTASKTIYDFRSDVATANARITDGQGTYVQWNYYQYTLYKILAQAQMGNKDSQQTIGQGNTGGSAQSTTGLGNGQGPYANSTTYSKLFIENSWGSLNEFVDNTYCSERVVKAGSGLSPVSNSSSFTIDGTDYTGGSTAVPSVGWITESYEGSATWDIPKTSSSSTGSYQTNDRVYSNTGNRVLNVGGSWSYGASAGLSYWDSRNDLSISYALIGSRLAYYAAGDAPATVTIAVNDANYGTVDVSTLSVPVGTSVSASGNVLTVGTTPITATPAQATAQYTYAFGSWGNVPAGGTITSDVTITANFTATVNQYTVTVNVNEPTYGTVSPASVTVDYGTSISASGNVLTIGSNTVTQTPTTATAQYTYSFDSWTGTTATVTGDMAVTANFSRAVNQYTITITVNNSEYGSVSTSSVTVDYDTQISAALNVLSIGSTDVTATPSPATTEYSYAFDSWQNVPSSVTGDATITANFTRGDREYTVTISIGQPGYGSVDVASVQVPYGTSVSASSNVLSVGSTDVTATPTQATAQYTYAFVNWTDIPSGGEITDDTVITANFSRTVNQYTVTIVSNDANYGTVDVGSVTVDYGTSVSASSNVLSVGSTDSTATPTTSTAQYTYAFDSWSGVPQSGDVQADVTITAVFTRTTNQYTVTISVNDAEYGSVSSASMTVDYGTSVSTLNNVLSIGSTDVTATPQTSTAQYTYAFGSWTGAPQTVTEDVTITANFTRTLNQYTISIVSSNTDYGTVSQASITVDYGTAVSTLNNVLTIGSTDVTATANQPTAQYTFSFLGWLDAPQTVTGNVTVTANFDAAVNQYTITIEVNNGAYGSVSPASVTVDYGTPITAAQNVLTIGSNTVTATPTASTAQYTYAFIDWTGAPETVTGDVTITANFSRTVNEYTVTISVSPEGYGTVDLASVTVPYGTQISVSGNVLTVGEIAVTATPTPATAQYIYSFDSWTDVPEIVTGDANVTAEFSRTVNVYTITYNGNGGTPASVTETYEYGASADLTKRVIKSGYDFLGWNTESTATEPLSSYTVTGDAVLFAVFEDHVPVVIDAEEFIGALTHTESQRNMYGNILILIPLMIAIAMIVGLLSYVGLIQTRKN